MRALTLSGRPVTGCPEVQERAMPCPERNITTAHERKKAAQLPKTNCLKISVAARIGREKKMAAEDEGLLRKTLETKNPSLGFVVDGE